MALDDFVKEVGGIKTTDKDAFADEAKKLAKKHLGQDCSAEELIPFGMIFREKAEAVAAGTSASVSVTVTIPPDTDTDPPD